MADTKAGGVTVKDVTSHDFVIAYAAHLKRIGKIEVPKWADLVKTGTTRELAPYDPDWYYIRAAAIARRVYLRGGIGVGAFKRIFGGRKMRGTRPEHFMTGSGSIARHILEQFRPAPAPPRRPAPAALPPLQPSFRSCCSCASTRTAPSSPLTSV